MKHCNTTNYTLNIPHRNYRNQLQSSCFECLFKQNKHNSKALQKKTIPEGVKGGMLTNHL